MNTVSLDQSNALFETISLIPFFFGYRAIVVAKSSAGVSLWAEIMWIVYSIWYAFYLFRLDQYYSSSIFVIWVVILSVKIRVIMKFRPIVNHGR